ncbi:MAG: M3 family oligoendopeptidase [Nanoarchaeota archaeon]|nr:M3 family oligoendopeptidase [Nanoarchaeota archaeon]
MAKKEGMRWNLDEILPAKKFDELWKEIEQDISKYDFFLPKFSPEMDRDGFVAFMKFDEKIIEKLARLGGMPCLWESTDQKSQEAKLLKSKAEDLVLRFSNKTRKISLWLQGKEIDGFVRLDDKNAERLFKTLPALQYGMMYSRKLARHTLLENEEKIITEKDMTGAGVLVDLRELIETEFCFKFKPKGKKEKIFNNAAELLKHVYSKNANEREAACNSLLEKYKENIDKFFMVYQAIVKDWRYDYERRGYESAIQVRNIGNHVPDKAIEVLLDVCRTNRDVYQRYFRFKAKELGMKRLRRHDIYAPLKIAKDEKISYEESKKLVLSTFDEFSKGFGEKARRIINDRHIDSHPRQNKRGGAFCLTLMPSIAPYVLLNYTHTARDVSTMAHELGHGIHSLYAAHLPMAAQHANLPLSETASTFGEMVVFEKMLEKAKNDKVRKAMLSDKMADSFATILRQAYFVMFEKKAHEAVRKGITAEQLSGLYMEMLKEQFGDSVDISPIYRYEWARIPHIVATPFYCYAYNFGELLSMALFARYKKEGVGFVPKIEKVLSYGGSEDPDKVLKEIGVDMCSREFWEGSFEIVRGWQEKLEQY